MPYMLCSFYNTENDLSNKMNKLLADFEKKLVIPSGVVNGVMAINSDDEESSSSSDEGLDNEIYEQDYVGLEMKKYAQFSCKTNPVDKHGGMSDVEGVEEFYYKNNPLEVYEQYNFTTTFLKKELPIDSFKDKILHMIQINNVVIIQGPTGCGKTTQVPQYILDYCREKQEYCNIAVTQPRKIATINVARRVCEERGWTLGTVCGYQVGLEKKISPHMLLTYMTTGVLLQKIIHAKTLHQFTHIIIDEVHERNQDLDFLLLIVRRFLFTNSPKTKVILMSATIDAEEFAYYFRSQSLTTPIPAPIIFVNKKSNFMTTIFYLENLTTAIDTTRASIPAFDIDKPEISEGLWKVFTFLISIIDKLDSVDPITNNPIIGSVLVFLPGINEIEEANRLLENHFNETRVEPDDEVSTSQENEESTSQENEESTSREKKKSVRIKWEIIPLHSSLPNDEQAKAFKQPKPGHRKIILSTNIAESSITVPDSYYVIDFCQTKIMTVNPITKYMSLKLEWASHVNCEQRAGRVGRIGNGRVYRLVPRDFYMKSMSKKSIPEIIRAPLERIVLQAKMLNLNDTPQQILALAINPPNLKNIEITILSLKEIGGLLQTCRDIPSSFDGDITFLGIVMAGLPIDVRFSKLIILGHLFSCLEEAIIIAAGCSIQNIFSIPFQQRFNAYKKLLLWADGSFSDLIALLNLYQVWQSCKRDNQFENFYSEQRWCTMNLVNLKGLREWSLLVTEIKQRLEHFNIKQIPGQIELRHDERPLILKIITAGAFYPNFFIKNPDGPQFDEREAVKIVGGRDPFRSVYFTGMDASQPGPLYIRAIKEMLKNERESENDVNIGFDGSSKVYVEFKNLTRKREQITLTMNGRQMVRDTIPGKIPKEVYETIRKRQLKYQFNLKVLPVQEAWRWAERNGMKRSSTLQRLDSVSSNEERHCYSEEEYCPIPSLDTEWITLKISEFIDAAHFWVNTLESEQYLAKIEEILNKMVLHKVLEANKPIKMGKYYAAKYHEDNIFYRCQVISHGPNTVQILFIDYGNTQQVHPKDLYLLPNRPECEIAPLGVECVLYGVQPSKKLNPKYVWSDQINNHWKKQIMGVLLYGKVHSVVDDVVHLELFKNEPYNRQVKSLNEMMILHGHGEVAMESFLSKADHERRLLVRKAENPNKEATRLSFDKVTNYQDFEAPHIGANCRTVQLKGPFSPLEMKIYGCIESASNKTVDIEGNSVNTVLLDNDLEDYHTRLLVAGYVGQTASDNRLKLRQTTVMPNVPGLPMLLSLIFCPSMRVKLTDDGTRVASILCGLGFNPCTQRPYYPSHDLSLVLDTELVAEEVNKINIIRFYMNQGIKLMYDISQGTSSQGEILRIQSSLKKDLIDLIYIPRNPVQRVNVKYANLWGKNNVDARILKPSLNDDSEDIWPLLWFVELNHFEGYNPEICSNLEDLESMARNLIPTVQTECKLCQVILYTIYEIRHHLMNISHKEVVRKYYECIQQSN